MQDNQKPAAPASERDPNNCTRCREQIRRVAFLEAEHRQFLSDLGQRLGPRGIEDLIAAWRLEREIDAEDAREERS